MTINHFTIDVIKLGTLSFGIVSFFMPVYWAFFYFSKKGGEILEEVPVWLVTSSEFVIAIQSIIIFVMFIGKPMVKVGIRIYNKYVGNPDKTNTERIKDLQSSIDEMEVLKQGQRALLRNQILTHSKQALKKGCISTSELENINEMMEPYEGLGGNGTTHSIVQDVRKLPKTGD